MTRTKPATPVLPNSHHVERTCPYAVAGMDDPQLGDIVYLCNATMRHPGWRIIDIHDDSTVTIAPLFRDKWLHRPLSGVPFAHLDLVERAEGGLW